MFLKIFVFLVFMTINQIAYSKEYKVEMLNESSGQAMTFKPIFLKVDIGDSIIFVPTTKGHTSESLFVPSGANTWKGEVDQKVKVVLNKEGIYIYQCQNHGIMGMVGIIQVGKPLNLTQAKDFYDLLKNKIVLNKNRLDEILNSYKN